MAAGIRWIILLACCLLRLWAQKGAGELRLLVSDPLGAGLEASGVLISQSTHVEHTFQTGSDGRTTLQALPFGPYRLQINRSGFAPYSALVEIRSAIPLTHRVILAVTPIETTVEVRDADTLLNPQRTGTVNYVGPETLLYRQSATPGRSVLELVNTQPGWLLEANGILHPRGSEYDVQYVIDGLPLFDNRSPAFAQSLGVEEFESMKIITGGYPAEYGRKLGGVIEVTTERDPRPGFHGSAALQGGSLDTEAAYLSGHYRRGRTAAGLSVEGMRTDRYLDAPVEQNYTNHGSGGGVSARLERDWSDQDRTRFYVHRRHTGFLVPNERLQQEAGQRQDRTADEASGQFSHEHIFSPRMLGTFQGRFRDTSAALWSNPGSTPILPAQDRGFRELYASASVSAHLGSHELKTGSEVIFSSIHENFSYRIIAYRLNGVRIFDRDLPPSFNFSDRGQNREQSLFVQDLVRRGRFTFHAGLRYDHYMLRVDEHAFSPRFGVAYQLPSAGLVLRASYDRVFQTPAVENILLASSDLVQGLGGEGIFLPLRPARGNFYETGFSKTMFGKIRLDGTYFHRSFENLADDSLLLNTGVSFPTAFRNGTVYGYEAKIEIPRWGPVSGFGSWGNLLGRGKLPIAGGLFLGDDAAELFRAQGTFPISQDQRNTVRTRVRYQIGTKAWAALGARYNSGLPVEIEGQVNKDLLTQQYGPRILERVNFERERVRPIASLDASAGLELWKREKRTLRLQVDLNNLTDRLNVINFASLFSGTAIEPRRSFSLRLQAGF